jgi:hypothetical protein
MTRMETRSGSARAQLAPRPTRRGIDATSMLTVYLVLLLVVPSSLTITALGSVGKPATLWALGLAVWWAASRLQRFVPAPAGAIALKFGILAFVAVVLLSYAAAMLRVLPSDEVSPADSGVIRIIGWAGVALVACDGINDPARFRLFLRRIAIGGTLMAILGLLQFVTKQSLLDWISIPGFSSDVSGLAGLDDRAGFVRASGTAIHPLEYGTVLCIALPIAITLAVDAQRFRVISWLPVLIIGAAGVLAVSRSALIGVAAGVIVLIPAWSRRVRWVFGLAAIVFAVGIGIAVPGIVGTLRGLFLGIGGDASTVSRVDGFASATEFIGRFPILGKGFGTFLPIYHILDDQYLLLAVEVGILGFAAFVWMLGAALVSVWRARRMLVQSVDRNLAQALMASTFAGAVLLAFFDGFSFPMCAGMMFLAMGLCGGMLRLAKHAALPRALRD